MSDMKSKWEAMEPEKRQQVVKFGAIAGALILGLGLYYGSGQDEKNEVVEAQELTVIDVGEARLEDDIRAQVQRERQEQDNRNSQQDQLIDNQNELLAAQEAKLAAMQATLEMMSTGGALGLPGLQNGTGGPDDWETGVRLPDERLAATQEEPLLELPIETVGGIGRIEAIPVKVETQEEGEGKFYLPVGFMEARVLTGLRAKTVDGASENPEPMLLRVQAPAVLPNDLRSDLQGCLVVAHGFGDLSSERIETRLVSLNCLDASGKTVIEEEITGIVVDKDGVKGLAAHPVSKMGANMARLALASAIQGAGEAFSEQQETVSISPLGQTQVADPNGLGRAAAGNAATVIGEEYVDIISDLVRQQAPVLEMGPGKDVVVALTEGVWLSVKSTLE